MNAYRETCVRCIELEARVAELELELRELLGGLRPYQVDFKNSRCPFCGAGLSHDGKQRSHHADDRYCPGDSWWRRSCSGIKAPHMHRHCGWCEASWLERPASIKRAARSESAP